MASFSVTSISSSPRTLRNPPLAVDVCGPPVYCDRHLIGAQGTGAWRPLSSIPSPPPAWCRVKAPRRLAHALAGLLTARRDNQCRRLPDAGLARPAPPFSSARSLKVGRAPGGEGGPACGWAECACVRPCSKRQACIFRALGRLWRRRICAAVGEPRRACIECPPPGRRLGETTFTALLWPLPPPSGRAWGP